VLIKVHSDETALPERIVREKSQHDPIGVGNIEESAVASSICNARMSDIQVVEAFGEMVKSFDRFDLERHGVETA
jgi:hypothetical protein